MEAVQKVLKEPTLKYREVHQVRWLSFYQALDAVYRTLDSLVSFFSTATDVKASGICLMNQPIRPFEKQLPSLSVIVSHGTSNNFFF